MRLISCFAVMALAVPAVAQDPAQQILVQQQIQQSIQLSQQATQQAMQASLQANQQTLLASQQASAPNYGPSLLPRPKLSLKAGTYDSPQTLRLTDSARGATIYYTTDGWTPTPLSAQYDGPITLTSTTHLQAIAVSSYGKSLIVDAQYNLPQFTPPPPTAIVATPDGVLQQGTEVNLAFDSDVDSKSAQVGDKISLQLVSPLKIGDRTLAPTNVTAQGTVIHVDHKGAGGAPGVLTVRVDWLRANGITVPLTAVNTIEGKDHVGRVRSLILIPVIGIASLAQHGEDAEISKGTPIVARVVADTDLEPGS
jgi:Chitobiase/beta-hexosaminidase C-terminal domain